MIRVCLTVFPLLLLAFSAVAAPFTYQGRLDQDGQSANGHFDFELRLFDAGLGGTQVGSSLAFPAVTVVDGLFLLEPDFGDPGFDRSELWLEVAVRDAGSGAAFVPLEPRTRVGAVPLAARALSAGPSMPGEVESLLKSRANVPSALRDAAERHACDQSVEIALQAADGTRFPLTALYATEGLSRLPDIWAVFDTANARDPSQFLGQFSRIDLTDSSGTTHLGGLGFEFHVDDLGDGSRRHVLRIRPDWAGMLLTSGYAIYQGLGVPDIASMLLGGFGLNANQSLVGNYQPRDYVVMYNETSLDFIHRILAEVGIFYLFNHGSSSTTATLTDTAASLTATTVLDYLRPARPVAGFPHLSGFSGSSRLYAEVVTARAYNPDQPALLESRLVTGGHSGENYRFLADVSDGVELGVRNRARADAIEAAARTISGTSNALALRNGTRLTVNDKDAVFDGEYIVAGVTHLGIRRDTRGGCFHYANSFEALPSESAILPLQPPPKPVPGLLRGFVVGPAGEPTHTDGQGRIKVQFHWDRDGTSDENSSAFLRAMVPFDQTGFIAPEIGDEVLVGFVDGDPDRPVVLGRLFNGNDSPL